MSLRSQGCGLRYNLSLRSQACGLRYNMLRSQGKGLAHNLSQATRLRLETQHVTSHRVMDCNDVTQVSVSWIHSDSM